MKRGIPERVLNEIESKKTSDTEIKTLGIRKLIELSENYQKLQRSYKELTEKYISMKRDRNYEQEPEGNEEYNFWI